MNNIFLKIEYNKDTDSTISSLSADKNINNVSSPLSILTKDNNGSYGKSFVLGYLPLTNGYVGDTNSVFLSEKSKYNGYMFDNSIVTMSITGTKAFDTVIINFDRTASQYATVITLDIGTENSKTIDNTNYKSTLKFNTSSTEHTVSFLSWARNDYNGCITSIHIKSNELIINRNNIQQLSTQSQYMVDNSTLDYGMVTNSATITIYDTNHFLKDKIDDGTLPVSSAPAIIELNGRQLQSHIITDSDYNSEEQILNLTLSDRLSYLEKINFSGIEYGGKPRTLYDMINDKLISYYNIDMDDSVKSFMKNLIIPYPYMEASNLRTALEKICRVCRCGISLKDNGTIYMFDARPRYSAGSLVALSQSYMISNVNRNIIKKNKYKTAIINYKKPLIKTETGANIYTDSIVPTGYEDNVNNQEEYRSALDTLNKVDIYAYIKSYYAYINFQIPKKSKYGLETITKAYGSVDGEDKNTNINYSVTYTLKSGVATPKDTNFNLDEFTFSKPTSESEETGTIVDYKADVKYSYNISMSANIVTANAGKNNTRIVLISYDDYYKVSATILVGLKTIGAYSRAYIVDGEIVYIGGGEYQEYVPKTVNFQIYGDTYEISFDDLYTSESEDENSITLDGSELVQYGSKINGKELCSYLKDGIEEDYKDGVSTANVEVFTGNYGGLEWEKGEILELGDIVGFPNDKYPDGSQIFWKITGRTYKQDGSPSISLELQEAKE